MVSTDGSPATPSLAFLLAKSKTVDRASQGHNSLPQAPEGFHHQKPQFARMSHASPLVMLVDDEADHRTTTGLLLGAEGISVTEAASGEEALEILESSVPALILLDFHMEGMDGVQTLLKMRKKFDDRKLPILMLSGHQDPNTIAHALDSGANDYIDKLTHPKVLMARIRKHLHTVSLRTEPMPALGEFRLQKCLGETSVFTAFLLQHPDHEKPLVAKILKPQFSLKKDAPLPDRLGHPCVSSIVACSVNPVDYVLAEYRRGEVLAELLAEGQLSEQRAFRVMHSLTTTVGRIHQAGRLHLDLTPANVIIDESDSAFLLDLGLKEMIVGDNEVSGSDFFYGEPAFQSPEILKAEKPVDARADLYSLGALFFAMLTGRAPFQGGPKEIEQEVTATTAPLTSVCREDRASTFDILIERLLAKKADERYGDAEQLLLNLQEFGKGLT